MPIQTIDTPEATITIETRPSGDGTGTARTTTVTPKPGTSAANQADAVDGIDQALGQLRAFVSLPSPSNAQVIAAVKLLCRVTIRLARLQLGWFDGVE
jgi:hypothetical protein